MGRGGESEGGIGTRRRPIGRDYAAAKDAEGGDWKGEVGIFRFRIWDCGLRPTASPSCRFYPPGRSRLPLREGVEPEAGL